MNALNFGASEPPASPQRSAIAAFLGSLVELRPANPEDAAGLWQASRDPALWRFLPQPPFADEAGARDWLARRAAAAARGQAFTYTLVERVSGAVAGAVALLDLRPDERALEIGDAWIAPRFARRGLMREAVFLLLKFAFDDLGAVRVAFVVDEHNGQARSSLVRMGAVYEGTMRYHRSSGGQRRNSALYSVIKPEWPQVRAQFEFRVLRATHTARLYSLPSAYLSGA